jgi:hypothetical protein
MGLDSSQFKINRNAVGIISFILIGILLSFIYLNPFLGYRDTMFLRLDWHHEFQMTGATWITLSKYHEFPFWNPYKNGGTFLFAHPQSFVLSPETLFVLMFGPVTGLYYAVLFFYILGFAGCYFVGRYFKLSYLATLYLAILYTFQSHAMNYLFLGAHTWMTMGCIPFAFYFLLKSQHDFRYGVAGGFFHALVYLSGNTYIFMLFMLFIAIFAASNCIIKKNLDFAKGAAMMLLFAFLFASIKIIPGLDLYEENQRVNPFTEILPLKLEVFQKTFLDKNQAWNVISVYWIDGKNFHWPHFGDYIGIVPILLFIAGLILFFNRWEWVIATIGALLIYLSNFDYFSVIWKTINHLPLFNALQHPARFVIFLVLMMSLFGAKLISYVDKLKVKGNALDYTKKILLAALILFVFIDLTRASYIITSNMSPFKLENQDEKDLIQWDDKFETYNFYERYNLNEEQIAYFDANYIKSFNHFDTLSNKGSNIRVLDNIPLVSNTAVLSKGNPDYKGEYYFLNDNISNVNLVKWSPNKISLRVKAEEDDILIINQNYNKNWKIKEDFEIVDYNSLLGVKIPKGEYTVNLYMFQSKFLIGLALFLIAVISGAYLLVNAYRNDKLKPAAD